jgi:hypothetical protein
MRALVACSPRCRNTALRASTLVSMGTSFTRNEYFSLIASLRYPGLREDVAGASDRKL